MHISTNSTCLASSTISYQFFYFYNANLDCTLIYFIDSMAREMYNIVKRKTRTFDGYKTAGVIIKCFPTDNIVGRPAVHFPRIR